MSFTVRIKSLGDTFSPPVTQFIKFSLFGALVGAVLSVFTACLAYYIAGTEASITDANIGPEIGEGMFNWIHIGALIGFLNCCFAYRLIRHCDFMDTLKHISAFVAVPAFAGALVPHHGPMLAIIGGMLGFWLGAVVVSRKY
jgi:hypothetical protein